MKLFLVLSIWWACDLCEAVQPRLRLANGRVLPVLDIIYILYGAPLELFCTGEGYGLQMTVDLDISGTRLLLPTTRINKTTIRYFEERPERGSSNIYACEYNKTTLSHQGVSFVRVVIDSLPVAEDFRCKSMNFEYLNCSWTSNHFLTGFKLYYVKDGSSRLLCETQRLDHSNYCVWDKKHPLLPYRENDKNLTFSMNTCNGAGCTNKTFVLDHKAIVKFHAPEIELDSISSYGAILRVDMDIKSLFKFKIGFLEQKISYWYAGIHQMHVNTSLVALEDISRRVELELPCANELYEVRMSIRRGGAGEEYWSDDAIISFATEPDLENVDSARDPDPTCHQPRSEITQEVMLYKIDELVDKIKEEQNELKMRIETLKIKADYYN